MHESKNSLKRAKNPVLWKKLPTIRHSVCETNKVLQPTRECARAGAGL